MPAAGQVIRALDFPSEDGASDTTTINDISATTPQVGTPEVSVTVIAGTSGKIKITVGGGARDNGGSNRMFFEPIIREGDSSGAIVHQPAVTDAGYGTTGADGAGFAYAERSSIAAGLTPGAAYWCAVTYRVSAGATVDMNARSVLAAPAT